MKSRVVFLFFLFGLFNLNIFSAESGLSEYENGSVVFERSKIWRDVQKKALDTVVQIFVNSASFNWE